MGLIRFYEMKRKYFLLLVLLLQNKFLTLNCIDEYIIADGIKITKLHPDRLSGAGNSFYGFLKAEEHSIEYELEIREKKVERAAFPSKCHVCRLFAQELLRFIMDNGEIEQEREGKHPLFVKNGNVIYRAMQEVCSAMKGYRITRVRPFRYMRGGSTPIREMFNEAQKNSPIKNWMYSVPESELDDPTGEMKRLQGKCEDLLVDEEDRIINWFFKAQEEDPVEWLCRKRILKKADTSCLDESMDIKPEFLERIEENAKKASERKGKTSKL